MPRKKLPQTTDLRQFFGALSCISIAAMHIKLGQTKTARILFRAVALFRESYSLWSICAK